MREPEKEKKKWLLIIKLCKVMEFQVIFPGKI